MCILDCIQPTFFFLNLGKFLKELADYQYSSIAKGSQTYVNYTFLPLEWADLKLDD